MPIFNNEITFIHIPKCGGTSVEEFMLKNNYKMSLFTSTGSIFINAHTPQHCTYKELKELGLLTRKVFTIVRPEMDRVVSEYFYILEKRPDLKRLFNNFDEFLELFLNKENSNLFDNHNLSNSEFLINETGEIDNNIKIFNFFDKEGIEEYLGLSGLDNFHCNKTDSSKKLNILKEKHIEKIKEFYDKK
jgi:hypothetical protein